MNRREKGDREGALGLRNYFFAKLKIIMFTVKVHQFIPAKDPPKR